MENQETKKMTLSESLEYVKDKGMNAEALAKLEEIYSELRSEKR